MSDTFDSLASPLSDRWTPLLDWLKDNAPRGASLSWGDDHATNPEFIHTSWVDVILARADRDLGWGWFWTIVGPDDEDAATPSDEIIVLPYDRTLWRNWDPSTLWWAPEPCVITPFGEVPTLSDLALFELPPSPAHGWSLSAINSALSTWVTLNASRPDLTFVFDDSYHSAMLDQVLGNDDEDSLDPENFVMLSPGIMASPRVFDTLLAMPPDVAAGVSQEIITKLGAVLEYMKDHGGLSDNPDDYNDPDGYNDPDDYNGPTP